MGAQVVVVGAGVGGLATAIRLRSTGHKVTVLESHSWPGGKMRHVESTAGPIDAGPTVLTMRHVFDDLFRSSGVELEAYLQLEREPCLARHFWPDGSQLDLFDDRAKSINSIVQFAGARAGEEFEHFANEAEKLFTIFESPMMLCAEPSTIRLALAALSTPSIISSLLPKVTLARKLSRSFSERRLRQLFGRYATYVGGSPLQCPALLTLIWRAEEAGVWRVKGGLHKLANAMAQRLIDIGGELRLNSQVSRITTEGNAVQSVELSNGSTLAADTIVFAGDPRALATGLLGEEVTSVAKIALHQPRSYSAHVWSFAARTDYHDLQHHNVFFAADPESEFVDLAASQTPIEPTIYVCAQDRGSKVSRPDGDERFEIILNAPALRNGCGEEEEYEQCRHLTFDTLAGFGLRFQPTPEECCLTSPKTFDALFPGSAGALYGQTPEGIASSLKRPRARTTIRGLYLAGGGVHPGAGVPTAALSGQHAAEVIEKDLAST